MSPENRRIWIVLAPAISAFGGWYHNIQEFPGMSLTAPEMVSTVAPTQTAEHCPSHLLYGIAQAPALFVLWLERPREVTG